MEENKYTHFKINYYSNKVFVSFLKRKSTVPKNGMDFLNKLNKEKKSYQNILDWIKTLKTKSSENQ